MYIHTCVCVCGVYPVRLWTFCIVGRLSTIADGIRFYLICSGWCWPNQRAIMRRCPPPSVIVYTMYYIWDIICGTEAQSVFRNEFGRRYSNVRGLVLSIRFRLLNAQMNDWIEWRWRDPSFMMFKKRRHRDDWWVCTDTSIIIRNGNDGGANPKYWAQLKYRAVGAI